MSARAGRPSDLLADDLDQDALAAASVEFAVEDLLPGAEVEAAVRDGDDDLAAHDLALEVGVGVVLAGVVGVARRPARGGRASRARLRSRGAGRTRRR